MNIYLVVSESLKTIVWEDWFNYVGHEESYCIAELVIAKSRGQAKWLAWKSDEDFTGDPRDMPKFSVKIRAKNVEGPPRIISNESGWVESELWSIGEPVAIGGFEI